MPSQLSYPGVYIEEIPSGVRTITGVATSIALFVGWAPQGPTDRAVRITSFTDFERKYGGLFPHEQAYLGYSVRQFFDNGGSDAYILRLAATDAKVGSPISQNGLQLTPSSAGAWCNQFGVRIEARDAEGGEKRFQLSVIQFERDATGGVNKKRFAVVEHYANLSMRSADPRFVEEVIRESSQLIVAKVTGPNPPQTTPAGEGIPFAGGNNGQVLSPNDGTFIAKLLDARKKILDKIDLFNLLCVPALTNSTALQQMQAYCQERRAMAIVDCSREAITASVPNEFKDLTGSSSINAAFYFPWLRAPDPLSENRLTDFPPCGFMAGVYSRTDATRGVWKAPAGIDASLTGVAGPNVPLTDAENGILNVQGINCIRNFPVYNTISWGARTMRGDDQLGSEWKYVPVRRTALFIEESLFRGLKWVVFEPNDEPLWSQIRLNVGAFMNDLFRQGAFQGRSPREAYFVKCDGETTNQNDINRGIVNIVVGFAPLKPAEFVVIKITQIAGQIET